MAKRVPVKKAAAKTYKSAVLAAIHENAADLFHAGAIDSRTMRAFDTKCLAHRERKPRTKD